MHMCLRGIAICVPGVLSVSLRLMQPWSPKRARGDAVRMITDDHVASFWYVRANQQPVSLRLHTQETGEKRVAYDGRRLHGNWECTEQDGVKTIVVGFNANPDHRPRRHTFHQIGTTEVYRHVGNDPEWTVTLIYLPDLSW